MRFLILLKNVITDSIVKREQKDRDREEGLWVEGGSSTFLFIRLEETGSNSVTN